MVFSFVLIKIGEVFVSMAVSIGGGFFQHHCTLSVR